MARPTFLSIGVLLFVACSSFPLYDRAEIKPGPAVSGGVALGTGWTTSGYPRVGNLRPGYQDYYCDVIGTLGLRYGISQRFGLVLQGSLGNGIWLTGPEDSSFKPLIYEINAGAKMRTGSRSALLATLGYPSIFDLKFLYDFNRYLTGGVGIGLRGVALDLIGNLPLNRRTTLFLSGNITSGWFWLTPEPTPGFSLGAGIGFCP